MKKRPFDEQLRYLWNYRWSSLRGYVGLAERYDFVEHATVLAEYGGDTPNGRLRYRKQLSEDLIAGVAIREQIVGQSILGSVGFVSWVKETFLEDKTDRERPDVGRIHKYLSKGTVLAVVGKETGSSDVMRSTGTLRQIVMTSLYKYGGLNNREIGELLGVDYTTVSQGRKRLREKTEKDQKVRSIVENIDRVMSRIKI